MWGATIGHRSATQSGVGPRRNFASEIGPSGPGLSGISRLATSLPCGMVCFLTPRILGKRRHHSRSVEFAGVHDKPGKDARCDRDELGWSAKQMAALRVKPTVPSDGDDAILDSAPLTRLAEFDPHLPLASLSTVVGCPCGRCAATLMAHRARRSRATGSAARPWNTTAGGPAVPVLKAAPAMSPCDRRAVLERAVVRLQSARPRRSASVAPGPHRVGKSN